MHLFAFILIGGIWAAFLLPSVLDGRRKAPASSTRSFARSQDLLASVATQEGRQVVQRKRTTTRRRRVLSALGAGAALSLVMAIISGSTSWLAAAIGFDVAFAGYVTLMLLALQSPRAQAPVVPLRAVDAPAEAEQQPAFGSVRVIAG